MSAETAGTGLSPLHRLWRLLPQNGRRAALQHMTSLLAPKPDQPPPPAREGIGVVGIQSATGMGEAARLTLHALIGLGVPAWPVDPRAEPIPGGAPLVIHGSPAMLPLQLLALGRNRVRGRRIIAYWPCELPVMPKPWRAALRFVHEIWAPSEFSANALAGNGVPVRVVPHPVSTDPPSPSHLTRADFGLPDDALITLVAFNLASSFERKNPLAAIAAHTAAFGDRADRILLLRVTNPHHFPDDFRQLQDAAAKPNVRIDTTTLARDDAHALMAACDIVLSLHRSEGFGLVPAEAMLLGKPVVATDWSGTKQFMDASCAGMVPARLVPARDPRGVFEAPGAVWAEPDVRAAADLLRSLADYPQLRRHLGERGRAAAQARLGPAALADAVAALGLLPPQSPAEADAPADDATPGETGHPAPAETAGPTLEETPAPLR